MNPAEPTPDSQATMALIEDIQGAIRNKEWRLAEQKATKLLDQNPSGPEALMYLGITRAAQGFEPEGETLLLASLTLDSKNKEAYYNLGLIVMNQGRYLLATDAFQHGLSLDPTNHALLYQLGRALERLCRDEEALDMLEKALLHPPDDELDFTNESKDAIKRIQSKP
ncbi:MAG: tetratricopeptide repeat protein [Candidatus Thorarchaeota archaeon]